jgi:glycosyltransferase involved in cell wall biosynthesis
MQDPLVSIVTPSFNQGHFIRATIESVLSQGYPNLEYIIMDAGSTDETASVVKDYSSRLTWISEKDRGQSHAINKGFRMARGEIVSWLNSDDTILPDAVQTAADALSGEPDAGAVYGEGYCMNREGAITCRFPHTEPLNLWKLVYLSDYILQQTAYFRRSSVEEVGFLNEELHYVMDWDLLIRMAMRRSLLYVPEYLGCIREYPEAKSFSGGARRIAEIQQVLCKHTGLRYPPGYIVYGLDTYRKIWCNWIDARTPASLSVPAAKLRSLILIACGLWIDRTIAHSQGWYSDGWAARNVRIMVPPTRGKAILIEGELPSNSLLHNQKLAVEIQGRHMSTLTLQFGPFRHVLAVPKHLQDQALQLRLKASRYFVPAWDRKTEDRRQLSFFLKRVGLAEVAPADKEGEHLRISVDASGM